MKLGIFVLLVKFAALALCQLNEEERIKNGQEVSGGDFSFTAKIQLNDKHICSAILVDSRWVVTLKNCIDKKKLAQYRVYMSSSESKGLDVMRPIIKLVVPDKKNNDIIMLQLNEAVLESTDKVKALNRFSTAKLDKKMKKCKVVGISENGKRLREVTASLKSSNKCKGKNKLCFDTKKGSVCKVDNGSPVVCQYKSKWYLTGSSFVKKKCTNKNINGFKLSFYSSAIKKVLKDNEIKGCGPLPDIQYANVLLRNSSSEIGARALVTCFQGFETNKTVLTCQQNKQWETTTCSSIDSDDYVVRLPDNITPSLYAIELQPDIYNNTQPSDFTFSGSVAITLKCLKDTSIITLNVDQLSIQGPITVNIEGSSENIYKNHAIDENQHYLYILTNQFLRSGERYILRISNFGGDLKSSDYGFFYGYDFEDGSKNYYAATQFQAISARTAFPCFDEAAIKSQYDITLVRQDSVFSLSNMPLANSTKRDDGSIADTFERTPIMSAYLLAFFVGNHDFLETRTSNGVLFRTWATPSGISQTQYALETGVKIQEYFVDYFNIQYPLPKHDHIAISNYNSGGMENWGLVVYADRLLLVEQNTSSVSDFQYATSIVSHEIAHTWVGNLVTCHWWDDLWLNEGFATYYQYTGVDAVNPEWKMWEQFIYKAMHYVMFRDGNPRWTHPLHNPVYKPKDIGKQIFTGIPYDKGAAILRMLSFIVGQNTFKEGMKEYLKKNSYKAVTPDDFYTAIEKQAKADKRSITNIKEIMDTWVLQMQFPLVEVEFTEQGKITLTQQKFEGNPGGEDPGDFVSPYGYKWNIPFAFTTSKVKNFQVRTKDITIMPLDKKKVTIKDDSIPKPKGKLNWVIGNPKLFGFYRVNYDKRNWNALTDQLVSDHKVIDVMNRAQIIEDAWFLHVAEYESLAIALRTLEYLNEEEEWLPWATAEKWLDYIGNTIESMPEYSQFEEIIATKTTKLYKNLYESEENTDLELLLKDIVTNIACTYGLFQCELDTELKLTEWKQGQANSSDENINEAAYCEALSDDDSEHWEFVFEQYKIEGNENRLNALACSENTQRLERLIEYETNTAAFGNDSLQVLFIVSKNPIGRLVVWDYVLDNWDSWTGNYTGDEIGSYLKTITREFATNKELKKFQAFEAEKADEIENDPDLEDDVNDIIEKIKKRNEWVNKNFPIVKSWLESQ